MTTYILKGYGFDVGANFARAAFDTPIELAPADYAKPGHVIGYIAGNPASVFSFMRGDRVRVHVLKSAIVELPAKPFCPHCGAYHEKHAAEYPSHGLA